MWRRNGKRWWKPRLTTQRADIVFSSLLNLKEQIFMKIDRIYVAPRSFSILKAEFHRSVRRLDAVARVTNSRPTTSKLRALWKGRTHGAGRRPRIIDSSQ